ncbi:uncharacterized protein LOC117602155 [Osmia lignaria lignaria]|uniref:uncharacterized protein LOC117602155 n=1 Tax=Osmia lignaria lignaria TaxID=1437193 RepID=UPI001479366C|nr:uncharacterized protein LOC117602155 [Osmia lignaria]XP_034175678.1 uncharacterized protein LOC117602155 [Osmia lignaria]XP_034175679.1 uncharacterized protein LOC117602155 [Osmia lignaria]
MSWLFGRKKHHKDSPPDTTEEDQSLGQPDDYVVVNKWPNPMPPNTAHDSLPYPGGHLYPSVPPVSDYSGVLLDDSSIESNQGENAHYLNGVPFKLCKRLDNNMNNNLEIDKLRISEMLSFIERIRNQDYDYSFSVEESVVAEMNNGSNE